MRLPVSPAAHGSYQPDKKGRADARPEFQGGKARRTCGADRSQSDPMPQVVFSGANMKKW
jgi:hypothetical protein